MILSDFHNSSANFCDTITGFDNSLQYWQLQSDNYSEQQISEMPLWINAQKDSFQEHKQLFQDVGIELFSDEQRLAATRDGNPFYFLIAELSHAKRAAEHHG